MANGGVLFVYSHKVLPTRFMRHEYTQGGAAGTVQATATATTPTTTATRGKACLTIFLGTGDCQNGFCMCEYSSYRVEVFWEYEYICSLYEYPMNAFRLDGELFVFARCEESCLCWGVFGIDFPSDLLVRA